MFSRKFRTSSGSQSDNAPNRRLARPSSGARLAQLCGAALCVLAVSGCGVSDVRVPVFPVTGKVSFQGKPPVGARVVLFPVNNSAAAGVAPSGDVKDDGSFTVTSYDTDDGAPKGDYVATVQWNKYDAKLGGAGPNVIPKQYVSATTSPIKVSVSGGPTEIPPIAIK